MKKALLALAFLLSLSALSQEESKIRSRNNYFYVSPIDAFLNTFELGYERNLPSCNTIFIKGGIKLSKKENYFDRLGGNGEAQFRINLNYDKALINTLDRRFSTFAYFAPYIQYRYEQILELKTTEAVPQQTATFVNSGFCGVGFGIRLTGLESRFCMNLFAGGGLKYSDVAGLQKYNDFLSVGYTGIAPKVSFQMGIAF